MPRKRSDSRVFENLDVTIDGTRYVGHYAVNRGIVEVHYGLLSESTQVGGSSPKHIARVLLHELVQKSQQDTRKAAPAVARDVSEAEHAMRKLLSSAPGEEHAVEQKLRRKGHSPGANFEARRIGKNRQKG